MTKIKSSAPTKKVTFFQVRSALEKQKKLVQIAQEYFEKKMPLLFKLESEEGIKYLDELLWRFPKESFLPHFISNAPSKELIILTLSDHNPNQSQTVFNLKKDPILETSFHQIYTFEDLSSSLKNQIAQRHYHFYKVKEYAIVSF